MLRQLAATAARVGARSSAHLHFYPRHYLISATVSGRPQYGRGERQLHVLPSLQAEASDSKQDELQESDDVIGPTGASQSANQRYDRRNVNRDNRFNRDDKRNSPNGRRDNKQYVTPRFGTIEAPGIFRKKIMTLFERPEVNPVLVYFALKNCSFQGLKATNEGRAQMADLIWDLAKKNEISFDEKHYAAYIRAFVSNGISFPATAVRKEIEERGIPMDGFICDLLSRYYSEIGDVEGVNEMEDLLESQREYRMRYDRKFRLVTAAGVNKDADGLRKLVDSASRGSGDYRKGYGEHSSSIYNNMLRSACNIGDVDLIMHIIQAMRTEGERPSDKVFDAMVVAFATAGQLDKVKEAMELRKQAGFEGKAKEFDLFKALFNGDIVTAHEIVATRGHGPSTNTLKSLMSAFIDRGDSVRATEVLDFLQKDEDHVLSPSTTISMFKIHALCGESRRSFSLLDQLDNRGWHKNLEAYSLVLDAIASANLSSKDKIHKNIAAITQRMHKAKLKPSRSIWLATLRVWAGKHNDVQELERVLEKMESRGFVPDCDTYGIYLEAIINSNRDDKMDSALKLIEEMKEKGIHVVPSMYIALVRGYASTDLDKAKAMVKEIESNPYIPVTEATYLPIIEALAFTKQTSEIESIIEEMRSKNILVTCDSFAPQFARLASTGSNTDGRDAAVGYLMDMKKLGISPNHKIYTLLLEIYGQVGQTELFQLLESADQAHLSGHAAMSLVQHLNVESPELVVDALKMLNASEKATRLGLRAIALQEQTEPRKALDVLKAVCDAGLIKMNQGVSELLYAYRGNAKGLEVILEFALKNNIPIPNFRRFANDAVLAFAQENISDEDKAAISMKLFAGLSETGSLKGKLLPRCGPAITSAYNVMYKEDGAENIIENLNESFPGIPSNGLADLGRAALFAGHPKNAAELFSAVDPAVAENIVNYFVYTTSNIKDGFTALGHLFGQNVSDESQARLLHSLFASEAQNEVTTDLNETVKGLVDENLIALGPMVMEKLVRTVRQNKNLASTIFNDINLPEDLLQGRENFGSRASIMKQLAADGDVGRANRYFQTLKQEGCPLDSNMYAAIIAAEAKSGNCFSATGLLKTALEDGIKFTSRENARLTISFLQAAQKGDATAYEKALELVESILKTGDELPLYVRNKFIDYYASQGQIDLAFQIFEQLKEDGQQPDGYTYNSLFKACAISDDMEKMQALYQTYQQSNAKESPNFAYNYILKMHIQHPECAETAKVVLKDAEALKSELAQGHFDKMAQLYAREGDLKNTIRTFNQAMESHPVSCNRVLAAFDNAGHWDLAAEFLETVDAGNALNILFMIKKVAMAGNVEMFKRFEQIFTKKYPGNLESNHRKVKQFEVITMIENGDLERAKEIADEALEQFKQIPGSTEEQVEQFAQRLRRPIEFAVKKED